MKTPLTVEDKRITARLIDSPAARDFASLLPLTLTMNDPFRREKFAHLPRAISNEGKHTHRHALGEIASWAPGPDIAVFYHHDGEEVPDPGIIVIGKVTSRLDTFNVRGAVTVKFERHEAVAERAPLTSPTEA